MQRLLGVDLTDREVTQDPGFIRYVRPALEMVGTGMFTEEFNARLTDMFDTKDET
jgi:hypothetical protein